MDGVATVMDTDLDWVMGMGMDLDWGTDTVAVSALMFLVPKIAKRKKAQSEDLYANHSEVLTSLGMVTGHLQTMAIPSLDIASTSPIQRHCMEISRHFMGSVRMLEVLSAMVYLEDLAYSDQRSRVINLKKSSKRKKNPPAGTSFIIFILVGWAGEGSYTRVTATTESFLC